MDRFAHMVVRHRKAIIAVFVVLVLVCAPLALMVKVNYNIIDYLPPSSQSTTAIELMDREFDEAVPNAEVMVRGITLPQALEYKARIKAVEGVESVSWLDDVVDLKQPLAVADKDVVKAYYRVGGADGGGPTASGGPTAGSNPTAGSGGSTAGTSAPASGSSATTTPSSATSTPTTGTALFSVVIKKGIEQPTLDALWDIVGPEGAVGGESSSLAAVQTAASSEVLGAFAILIPAIILILALSTSSWLEPLLLLVSIGVAIALNMGTNLIYGEVSFITSAVSPILQLAVSLDYAIFLLHSFADHRTQHADASVAMRHAIRSSFSTVASSASTTLFGFLALVFMEFLIGADLGISLAKGIIFSFVTSMLFLPALTLTVYRLIDRTKHRPLLPSFSNIHRVLSKLAIPVVAVAVLAVVPSYLGQSRTDFLYGTEGATGGTRVKADIQKIREEFGETNVVVTLVPRGDVAREQQLAQRLEELEYVTSVVSYTKSVGTVIPPEFLDTSVTNKFYSANYARLIIYTSLPSEGALTFTVMESIQGMAREAYGDGAYTMGRSMNLYDMKTVVQQDNLRVNLIAIVAIFLVLLVTFRSLVLPFILLLTIESAIWINLAIPYFADTPVNYIGYLVLNTVQLGATVDYAILLTNTYLHLRKSMPKREAIRCALGSSFKSILVSATVLTIAGFTLFATSTNPLVCDIGAMLGRGTLFSFALVVCFLPVLLSLLDPLIGRFTWKADFLRKGAGGGGGAGCAGGGTTAGTAGTTAGTAVGASTSFGSFVLPMKEGLHES
jgi:predicted RND superfamily exporter protein